MLAVRLMRNDNATMPSKLGIGRADQREAGGNGAREVVHPP